MSSDVEDPVVEAGEWVQECAALLADERFPAHQDDLLAALVRQRAPSRLLQHVAGLSDERVFTDLEDLVRACREREDASAWQRGPSRHRADPRHT
jgi:hypothetical protein